MIDAPTLQRCLTYVETQVGLQSKRLRARPGPTITISRTTGSGGVAVAERLAEFLQRHKPATPAPWTVFHRTLVEKVLQEHNLPAEMSKYMPEDRVSYIRDAMEELLGLHPSSTSLVTQTTETILHLAELGHCIIVGRASNVILAGSETAFHARVIGSIDRRTERVMAERKVDRKVALDALKKEDAARERYLKSNFDADLEDPLLHHLVLNTDWIPIDDAAELIGHAVLRRFYPAM